MSTTPATPSRPAPPRRPAAVRRTLQAHPWAAEVAIFATALLVYQLSRILVVGTASDAFENAAGLIRWEQSSGLFVELNIQQWLLNHLELTAALNWFYMYGHWTVTPLFFVWLYKRRRRVYPYVRNAFLAANGIALLIFMLFPVAPPRLVTGRGFVDTLRGVSDIDLRGGTFSGLFNPHAAVPSMHFGYAFMIGVVACLLLKPWPLRALALAYPALVFLTITGTANHYVVDSLAGGLVIAAGFIAVQAWTEIHDRLRPAHVAITPR